MLILKLNKVIKDMYDSTVLENLYSILDFYFFRLNRK